MFKFLVLSLRCITFQNKPPAVKIFIYQFLLIALFALCISSCKENKQEPPKVTSQAPKTMAMQVEGFIARPQTINESSTVPGNLMPFEETELHPEVSGRVVQLNIQEGAYVTKGTLLLKIYDGDLQAQQKKLEVQIATAQKTVERQAELLKINGISQQEVDLSSLQVNSLKADIDIIRTSIIKTELRAPFNGKLGLKNISPGAYVTPSTIVTNIRAVDQLKLEFTVPEKYSSRIRNGMNVLFAVNGSAPKYRATVIASESGITENSRSLKVRAIVTNKDKDLVAGSFAQVNLLFGENTKALMIPTESVVPDARNKKVIVYHDGIAKFQIVTTGLRDSSKIEIVSGINAGDTIVTTGLLFLKPDAKITITKTN
jgi:membrane fusion protein, multidrug efflux system